MYYTGAMIELYKKLTRQMFGHQKGPGKLPRADIRWIFGVPGRKKALCVLVVSSGLLGLRRFGGRTNSSFFANPKRLDLCVWSRDDFREQQLLLQIVSDIFPFQNVFKFT